VEPHPVGSIRGRGSHVGVRQRGRRRNVGQLTQSAVINLAVSAAIGTGGAGTPVDLSAAYNVYGIYKNGSTYTAGGLAGDGYSYKLLTPSRIPNGAQFNFGPPDQPDAVSGTGQPVALPAGQFSRLSLLASGVNGAQTAQAITVAYPEVLPLSSAKPSAIGLCPATTPAR